MPKGGAVGNAYHDALLRARARGHTLGRRAVAQLRISLKDALKRLDDTDTPLTPRRKDALRQQILGILREFEQLTVTSTAQSVNLTVNDVVKIHKTTVESLYKKLGKNAGKAAARFDMVATRAVQALASRERNAALFKTLTNRNMRAAVPDLDRLLQSAVSRGTSTRKLTRDIAQLLQGEFPSLQDYGMRINELPGMRTVMYDARRIALTETNNAMREANRLALHQSPIAIAAQWQLSGNHGEEDECDELAGADEFGYGPGFWRLDQWPVAPHPHCGCYPGEIYYRPIEEWDEPKVYEDAA